MAGQRRNLPSKKSSVTGKATPIIRPSDTKEGIEKQMEYLALKLAKQQLEDGSASPSVITHFLKMASTREEHEMALLEAQSKLAAAKANSLKSAEKTEELTSQAIDAFKGYSPSDDNPHE